jgi:diguanylate cyclase (GGDEF)-like protein
MHLDLLTLMAANSFVGLLCSGFLFFSWWQNRDALGLLWWAVADLLASIGIAILLLVDTDHQIYLALVALAFSVNAAATVQAARLSSERKGMPLWWWLGPVALVAFLASPLDVSPGVGVFARTAFGALYTGAAAFEFWRNHESLLSRWPLVVLNVVHAITLLVPALALVAAPGQQTSLPGLESWFGIIHLENLLYTIGTAFFVMAMVKEQAELQQRILARVDSLTGAASRHAFMEGGELILRRCAHNRVPLSIVVFDLDHFKRVNDTFGHAVGDLVLQRFGATARMVLRSNDIFGRIGGEEFAAALPDTDSEAAVAVAERVRLAFAETSQIVAGFPIGATVSGGVATARSGGASLYELPESADQALYRAKAGGRNRTELASATSSSEGDGVTLRVA